MAIAGSDPCSIGEGMYKWTKKAILNRQKILGKSTDRTPEEINYINNRRPWIKMASSVKVTDEGAIKLANTGLSQFSGRKLAKNFVMFGGTAIGTNNSRSGIGTGFNGAYGIGGTDFGLKPMPGIKNLRVRTKGKLGSLKEAQLTIKAYNKQQFDIIELLYLRLGYTILVEFGYNYYLSKQGEVRTMGGTIIDNYWFDNNDFDIDRSELIYLNKAIDIFGDSFAAEALQGKAEEAAEKINAAGDDNIKAIQNTILSSRIQYSGHYDGIIGKVTNFDYTIDKNGVYDINLTLLSYGDLLDSFYINTKKVFPQDGEIGGSVAASYIGQGVSFFASLFGSEEEPDPPEIPDLDSKFLKNAKDVTDINGILYMFYDGLYNSARGGSYANRDKLSSGPWSYYKANIDKSDPSFTKSSPADIFDIKLKGSDDDTLGEGYTDDKFISLGYYLEILNQFTLGYVEKDRNKTGINNVSSRTPSPVYFDNRQDRFFCNTNYHQISADPLVCLIKNVGEPTNILAQSYYRNFKKFKGGFLVGDIMNIYLQMNFLAELCYNSAKNEDAKITVIDHVEQILVRVNEALGGINELTLKIDEETGIAFIIDKIPFPGRKKVQDLVNGGINETENVEFLVYGFNEGDNQGSIVRDFSIKTKIPEELQTIITIGSQDTGYTTGFDATAFANWNQGLEDIVMPSLVVAAKNQKTAEDAKAELDKSYKTLATLAAKLYKNDEKVKIKYVEQTKNALKNYLTTEQALNAIINRDKGGGSSPAMGIIPLGLNLTIDGLSGIKVFQTYTINAKFLPSQYNDALDFILKGYTHEIDENRWSTKLESFSIPKDSEETPKTLVSLGADFLARITADAEQEKNDAEFAVREELFDARTAIFSSGGGFGGGGSVSGTRATLQGGTFQFDINAVIAEAKNLGHTFRAGEEQKLREVLGFMPRDPNLKNSDHAAYMLATFKAESSYNLSCYEAWYVCANSAAEAPPVPCEAAFNYFDSAKPGVKKDYRLLGVYESGPLAGRSKYYGRGGIQLTGLSNMEKYGGIVGLDLITYPDDALVPINSYALGSAYLNVRTFPKMPTTNYDALRISVNGGLNGAAEVKEYYLLWQNVFKNVPNTF